MNNSTKYDNCLLIDEMNSFNEFYRCLNYFIQSTPMTILITSLIQIITSFILNLSLIVLFFVKKELTVFDKIMISHATVDFMIGLCDFPFFILAVIFGYWPFNKILCIYWVAMDNALGSLEIISVLLMTWAIIRCILAPTTYLKENIIKHISFVILSIWFLVFATWTVVSAIMLEQTFQQDNCVLYLEQQYATATVIFVIYLVPLGLIVFLTIFFNVVLYKKKSILKINDFFRTKIKTKKTQEQSVVSKILPTQSMCSLNSQAKLTIIVAIFCSLYIPCYLVWFLSEICTDCVSMNLFNIISLVSYFPSFINPLVMLVINKSLYLAFFS